MNSKVVLGIKSDLVSYYKKYMLEINDYIINFASLKNYNISFDDSKTILIHLRLDDVDFTNRIDYNGSYSFEYILNKINTQTLDYNDEQNYYQSKGIVNNFNLYNCQGPISDYKIDNIITILKKKYSDYKVLIITSPIGNVTLPYNIIRSSDPSLDLYYLSMSKILVLSRSTFALSTLYFGKATEIWIPKWGYASSLGLESKYSNIDFNYFD